MKAELKEKVQDSDAGQTQLHWRIEFYLDAGYDSCVLREPDAAACAADAWLRLDTKQSETACLLLAQAGRLPT
jgi:hypothetical protein